MTTNYYFKWFFTKYGAGYAPSPAPTAVITDIISNTTKASGVALTAMTGITGGYFYLYTGADNLNLVGKATTGDTSVDAVDKVYEGTLATISTDLTTAQGNITTILADYARRTGDYSTLTAAQVWAVLTSSLTTSGSIGKWIVDKLDAAISAVLTAITELQVLIAAIQIIYLGPVPTAGDVEIVIGDDYFSADGRALIWTSVSWPTLTGGSVVLNVAGQSIAGTLLNSTKTATFELTHTQTGLIEEGIHPLEAVATLASGHIVTLVSANLIAAQ
jgi:hypothetical protein